MSLFGNTVIIGVSQPAYDADELAELKAQEKKTFEYEGKTYTGYEATQQQRKIETAIRRAKDRKTIAEAAGDKELALEETRNLRLLSTRYKDFSDKAGLRVKTERLWYNR